MKDPEKKKSYLNLFEALSHNQEEPYQNGHPYPSHSENPEEAFYQDSAFDSSCVLTDEIDHQILMHRDAHFGGDFEVMLNYYNDEESIGTHPDFDLERILYLSDVEKEMGQDLAPLILTGPEAEAVAQARHAYQQFKELYLLNEDPNSFPRLIADLVLSEEEEPFEIIESIVSYGTKMTPDLIAILKTDKLYDPLLPGYGYAPYLALVCLGKIGDETAIIPIFEVLSKPIVFDETIVIDALVDIGDSAKKFLLKILQSRPLTQDNSNAAFALTGFSSNLDVAIASFEQLRDPEVQQNILLSTYLICSCESLGQSAYKAPFIQMAEDPKTPEALRAGMQLLIDEWNQK